MIALPPLVTANLSILALSHTVHSDNDGSLTTQNVLNAFSYWAPPFNYRPVCDLNMCACHVMSLRTKKSVFTDKIVIQSNCQPAKQFRDITGKLQTP